MAPIQLRLTFEYHVWHNIRDLNTLQTSDSTIEYVSNMCAHQFLQQNDLAFNILEETVCSPELGAGTKTGIGSPYHQLALQASMRSLYDLGSVAVASYNHER